jgi:alkylation response protein AidB-like acyl-CoA dehydrogenase
MAPDRREDVDHERRLADVFIVFAKSMASSSRRSSSSAFPGVSTGKEEHKLGLLGSSTTPLILADAQVPAENLLGEIGKGHKIAFNVLNYGRFKLAAMCTGGAKAAIAEAVRYAATRRQFGQAIASFGAIKHKIAEMTIRAYGVRSALFRTAGLIDHAIGDASHDAAAVTAALEEFAIEGVAAESVGQR